MRALLIPFAVLLVWTATPAAAQAQELRPVESIQIGLSTDRISITSDFSGADLAVIGAIDNTDTAFLRDSRYDVVVVLEGPARATTVRRKDRVLGVWMNTHSETFVSVPASYSVATTRGYDEITDEDTYGRLGLGPEHVLLQPLEPDLTGISLAEFREALRERKESAGLYNERVGGVRFLSQNLFRASVALAPNIPLGTHRARAFLFRDGQLIAQTGAALAIYKAGFEQRMFEAAHQHSLLYGLLAVALAGITGWLGSIVFRRD